MPFLIHNIDPARQPVAITTNGQVQTVKHNESLAVDLREKSTEINRLAVLGKINVVVLDRMPELKAPTSAKSTSVVDGNEDSETETSKTASKKSKTNISGE